MNEAAKKVVTTPLSRMPHLISDRSLGNATNELANHSKARFRSSYAPFSETIFMPKKGYGPRPVIVMAPESRTLYQALIDKMTPGLPTPSRAGRWSDHEIFGLADGNDETRIVDFDIAACYEYIDHRLLGEELTIQTLDNETVDALLALLGEFFPRRVGIPQSSEASDLIADAYLGRLERGLIRSEYTLHRYADDFRIVAGDWGRAHEAIENAVSLARTSGLVLADGKTHVRSVSQVRATIDERESVLAKYRADANDNLRTFDLVQVDYDDFELVETAPEPEEVDFEAHLRIVEDWARSDREQHSIHARFGSIALRILQNSPDRVSDDWLLGIVERDPIRLPEIINYLKAREENEENWTALNRLTRMPRESPWARLWIATLADQLPSTECEGRQAMIGWAESSLNDRHETVRAEAAWFLSGNSAISPKRVAELFVDASDVTQIGLAAVAGRIDKDRVAALSKAIRNESTLTKAAFDWAAS
jgi:RNA-directed DNA polymerase